MEEKMKIFKIILILFFILFFALIVGIYIFLRTFDLNNYKPIIIDQAESTLNRDVDFSTANLQLSFKQGIAFELNNLVIGGSPSFQEGDFLRVEQISLGIDVLHYIFNKEVKILDIFLKSPQIVLIKNKSGKMDIEEFGQNLTETKPEPEKPTQTQDKQISLPIIYVDQLKIDNASLKFIDRTYEPEKILEISRVDFKISDFSPGKEAPFKFDMALFSDEQNTHSSGNIKMDADNQQISFSPLDLNVNLSDFSIEKMKSLIPKNKPFPSTLNGQFNVAAKKIIIGQEGLTELIADAGFSNGKIVLINEGSTFNLDKINAALNNLSLKDEFTYSLKMAYLNDSQNIDLNGRGQLDIAAKAITLNDLRFASDLATFSMSKFKESIPELKDSDLPEKMEGSIRLNLSTMQIADTKLVSLKGDGDFSDGKISFSNLPESPENINVKWNFTESDITIPQILMHIGQGELEGSASVVNYLTDRNFAINMDFQNMELGEILNQQDQSVTIEGKLSGLIKIQGQGLEAEKTLDTLTGNANLSFADGKLKNINILKTVLGKLTMFPNLSEILESSLPDKYKHLAKKDTILSNADIKANIKNREISLNQVNVVADSFAFDGTGKATFDKTYNLEGSFLVPADLSMSLADRINEVKYIFDEQNRIFIPLIVRGKETNMTFTVDLKYLTSKIIKIQGREQLKKVLDKTLDKEKSTPTEQNQQEKPDQQKNQERTTSDIESIGNQLINQAIDKLLEYDNN